MRLLLLALALAFLPGCAYWSWDSTERADGRVELRVTEMWLFTSQPKLQWTRGGDCYHPAKTVSMDGGLFGMQCSMRSDSGREP